MDRRGLWGTGKAYADCLLGLADDLLSVFLLCRDGGTRLHPSLGFHAHGNDFRRVVGLHGVLGGEPRTVKDLLCQGFCLGFDAPQMILVTKALGIKFVDILSPRGP